MKLSYIGFENYKAFKNPQLLNIKPITVIIGKNSSGKSILTRLPLLFAKSLGRDREEPIQLQFDGIEFGGEFKDLIYNRLEHGSIKVSLGFDDHTRITFEIQNVSNSPIQFVKNWSVESKDFNLKIELDLHQYKINSVENLIYRSTSEELVVTFKGVIPISISSKAKGRLYESELNDLAIQLEELTEKIQYIGPFRAFPDRIYRYSGSIPNKIGTKGELTSQVLAMSSFIDDQLISHVSDWYCTHLGGWRIDVTKESNSFEVVLVSPEDSTVKINIVDAGQGMSQVLPLIVRCFLNKDFSNSIEIIEQPELHLHPAAHGDLAELFALTAKREGSCFIIETHSENFLLRLRRLIVQGQLIPEDVIIYWVDDKTRPGSNLREITIDQMGDLSDWPEGVFSEDHEEILLIRKAQLEKLKK